MGGIKVLIGLAAIIGVLILYGANGIMVEDESDKERLLLSRDKPNKLTQAVSGTGGSTRTKSAPVPKKEKEYSFFDEIADMVGLGGDDEKK